MTVPRHRVVSGWVAAVGIVGTVLMAAGAFSLSFTSLKHLAVRSGVPVAQAWEWPLIVDGMIVVATVGAVVMAGRPGVRFFWFLLVGGALVSVTGNALQAVRVPTEEPTWVAAVVATIPPLVLLASTHMTVLLTRRRGSDNPGDGVPTGLGVLAAPVLPDVAPHVPTPGDHARTTVVPVDNTGDRVLPVDRSQTGDRGSHGECWEDGVREGSRTWREETARRLHGDGLTPTRIAQVMGISVGSVRRYLKPSVDDGPIVRQF